MSTLPTRSNGYALDPTQRATAALFEAVFRDLHERILAVEGTEADYVAAIDTITTQALQIVSDTISQEIVNQRATLAGIQTSAEFIVEQFEAVQNGVPASSIEIAPVPNLVAETVQQALAALVAAVTANKADADAQIAAAAGLAHRRAFFHARIARG